MRGWVGLALALAIVAGMIHAFAMPRGMASGDEGIRLAQVQQLAESNYTDGSLYQRGAKIDPYHRNDPFTTMAGFTYVHWGNLRVYGTYPLTYPALAVPFERAAGYAGVIMLSFIGYVLSLLAIARLARRCHLPESSVAIVVALSGLASPLLFYGGLLFEHTLATAALLTSITLVVSEGAGWRRMLGAGALYALATCFRTELYAFAPAMALLLGWSLGGSPRRWLRRWREWLAFAAGTVLVIVLFLIAHRVLTPFWHPTLEVSKLAATSKLEHRMPHLVAMHVRDEAELVLLGTAVAAALAWWFARRRSPDHLVSRLLPVAVTIAWTALAAYAIHEVDGVKLRTLTGLMTAAPLVALAIVRAQGKDAARSPIVAITVAAALFVAILVLLPKRGAGGGLEFGPRYLTPIIPLLFVGAVDQARRHWSQAMCASVLVAVGLWGTVVNLRGERDVRQLGATIVASIEEGRAEALVTPIWWVAQLAVPTQDRTSLFVVGGKTKLYDRLYDAGIRRVIAIRGGPAVADGRIMLRSIGPTRATDRRLNPTVWELVEPRATVTGH